MRKNNDISDISDISDIFDIKDKNSKINSSDKNIPSNIHLIPQSPLSKIESNSWLDKSSISTTLLDLNFNLQHINQAGIEMQNIDDITALYGKPYPFYFYSKSFRDAMKKDLMMAITMNKVVKQEARTVDMKHNLLWLQSTIIPVEDAQGIVESLVIISIDSTPYKQVLQELSKYRIHHKDVGLSHLTEENKHALDISFMTKATNNVIANMSDSNFDVNVLAANLFMSRSTLQRKLTKKSGVSAGLFIRQMRLAKAHEYIKKDIHKTLAETSHAVGFKHPGYFSKLYKRYLNTIKEGEALSFGNQPLGILSQNINDIYDNILSTGLDILSLTSGVISQIENNLYKIVAVTSENDLFISGEVFQLNDIYCREVFQNGKTLALTHFNDEPGLCKHPLYNLMPLEAYISSPIYKNGKVWGTLSFSSKYLKDSAFNKEDIYFIEKLAEEISSII